MYNVARVFANAERQQDHGTADVQRVRAKEEGCQQDGRRDVHAGGASRMFATLLQPPSARRPRGRASVSVFRSCLLYTSRCVKETDPEPVALIPFQLMAYFLSSHRRRTIHINGFNYDLFSRVSKVYN